MSRFQAKKRRQDCSSYVYIYIQLYIYIIIHTCICIYILYIYMYTYYLYIYIIYTYIYTHHCMFGYLCISFRGSSWELNMHFQVCDFHHRYSWYMSWPERTSRCRAVSPCAALHSWRTVSNGRHAGNLMVKPWTISAANHKKGYNKRGIQNNGAQWGMVTTILFPHDSMTMRYVPMFLMPTSLSRVRKDNLKLPLKSFRDL